MITQINSGIMIGIESHLLTVEVTVKSGKDKFFIVGMGDLSIQESRRRIRTAFESNSINICGYDIAVNLAPADLKKEGAAYDLPIAVGIMAASGYIKMKPKFLDETFFIGELSFDGSVRSINGALSLAILLKSLGKKRLVLPVDNAGEAALIPDIEVIGIKSLSELRLWIDKKTLVAPYKITCNFDRLDYKVDFADIKGQQQAKRAMQIAAAGHHNIIFVGPPGSGKTMLAERLPTIMPPLRFDEVVECTRIYSGAASLKNNELITKRPFRSPHHTISYVGLTGGGSPPSAGEISFAHNGILFLDELTEFRRMAIEALRQPLESKKISITRANYTIALPTDFLMVAALNPCPCGNLGDIRKACSCSPLNIYNYLSKISGPFLDRIDLQLFLHSLSLDDMQRVEVENQTSSQLYQKVLIALKAQEARLGIGKYNGSMDSSDLDKHCKLTDEAQSVLNTAFEKLKLTMRSYHKIIKVSRTIADLESSDDIKIEHIKEALMYRTLDQRLTNLKK